MNNYSSHHSTATVRFATITKIRITHSYVQNSKTLSREHNEKAPGTNKEPGNKRREITDKKDISITGIIIKSKTLLTHNQK